MVKKVLWVFVFSAFIVTFSGLCGTPAPERQYAVVDIQGSQDAQTIFQMGIILDTMTSGKLTVYVSDDEFAQLVARGYACRWLPAEITETQLSEWQSGVRSANNPLAGYYTYDTATQKLQSYVTQYPQLCTLVSAGKSVRNRDIWALKISKNVNLNEDEPVFYILGAQHGDEKIGSEMAMASADLLLGSYNTDATITALVDSMEIYVLPIINPDGYVNNTRTNANGVDLNRSYPDRLDDPNDTPAGRPLETQAIMNFFKPLYPISGVNFHAGMLSVVYSYYNARSTQYTPTPDDDVYRIITKVYANLNSAMNGSTTNAAGYMVASGVFDEWSYQYRGGTGINPEVSLTKTPSATQIPTIWTQNKNALIAFMQDSLKGVRGIVTDSVTGNPVDAKINVVGRNIPFFTDPSVGNYHRRLLPGTYTLQFTATGYTTKSVSVTIGSSGFFRQDVQMVPNGTTPTIVVTSPNGSENWTVGSSHPITWTSSNVTENVNVMYTVDGSTWKNIAANIANSGSYTWTIPNDPSASVRVKVSAVSGTPNDTSNNPFTISNGGVNYDINGDGSTNWTDVTFIAEILSGARPSVGAADLNADGTIDATDLTIELAKVAGLFY